MIRSCFFFLLIFSSLSSFADVRLPSVIGDHMVLQQNTTVKIWGWGDVNEKIKLKAGWDTSTYTATASPNAKWSIELKTPVAGGPYKITINARNAIIIDDVLIGEVWLCSGQSNMEMSASWGLKQFEPDVAAATNKNIRFFHIPRTTSPFPQEDVKAHWVVCNPEDMRRFSLAGYFFGQKINESLNVPVGLINSSWGGTPAEVWTPSDAIEQDPVLSKAAKQQKEVPYGPVLPAYAYNAMIYPLTNYQVAGALWYQGEANVGAYATYSQLFSTMINSWRKAWNKDFPFYFVQIAPYAGYGKDDASAFLREQQTKTLAVPHTGMVVTSDLVDNIKDIHPQLKKEVGLRLANYALAETYGKNNSAYKSPSYQSMKVEKNKIRISFNDAEKGLMVKEGKSPTEFYIAGDDKNFVPASAKIQGNTVVVWNKDVGNPVAVRFGFTNAATPNLFSKEGLPVNLFRTDDWDVHVTRVEVK
jgi:sialate O-acetylesterase